MPHRFLIIAGTPKAGTSSLFNYLAQHPEVAACRKKEPCFFLPSQVPMPSTLRYDNSPLSEYLALFPAHAGQTLLEASAVYLYEPESAATIASCLPQASIVVLLRDPIQRLVSAYNMFRLHSWFDPELGFDAFVDQLRTDPTPLATRSMERRSLEHGIYAPHLSRYFEVFGRERVSVVWFDELRSDPQAVTARVCALAGLDPAPLEDMKFKRYHEGREFRFRPAWSAYLGVRSRLGRVVPERSALRGTLRMVARKVDRALHTATTRRSTLTPMTDATRTFLQRFYTPDTAALEQLLGETVPWRDEMAPTGCTPD